MPAAGAADGAGRAPSADAVGHGGSDSTVCPLCGSDGIDSAGHAHGRDFLECARCRLTFVHPSQRPAPDEERARYETHDNDPADAGYRGFLDRLCAPLVRRLPAGARGLDYGSGPGPTLSLMLEERGFPTTIYDPFFAPDAAALERVYGFITCTETAEHFFHPRAEFERLDALLAPGGWLGVMTRLRTDATPLAGWWYARDATHVCFYRIETLQWIGAWRGWSLERPADDVVLFRKPTG